jgi:hypothetical protein
MLLEKKNIIILIVAAILIGILIIICLNPKKSPTSIIESKFYLKLPSTSKIIKFDYSDWDGDIAVKVQFNGRDLESIKNELQNYFGIEYDFKNNGIPFNGYGITWRDMDEDKIITCYDAFTEGEKHWFKPSPKTVEVCAFIVNEDGKYYLYIAS